MVSARGTTDGLIAAALFVLGVATRLPFRSQVLHHWDSVNFALATVRFDIAAGQPHAPGYILYVAMGWLGNLLSHDPQTTFVWISVLFSGLSASALFYLGSVVFDRRTGIVATLFLLASPLFWFYGEIALPHVVDSFFVILLALFLYNAWAGRDVYLLAAAPVLAGAGGIRPQTAAFLGALCLIALRGVRVRVALLAAIAAAVLSALWLLPLLSLSGGPARYLHVVSSFSQAFDYWAPVSGLLQGNASAFLAGAAKLAMYTAYGVGLAGLPLLIHGLKVGRFLPSTIDNPRTSFFVAWIAPALVFYLFVHMGQPGLVFVFLPALLLLAAAAVCNGLAGRHIGRLDLMASATILVLVGHAGIFLALPEYLPGPVPQKLLTWSTIKNLDQRYQTLITAIRTRFPPDRTVLVGANWRHVGYYLPEYRLVKLPAVDANGEAIASMASSDVDRPISAQTSGLPLSKNYGLTVVFVDRDPQHLPSEAAANSALTPAGPPLPFLSLAPDEALWWRDGRLWLEKSQDTAAGLR